MTKYEVGWEESHYKEVEANTIEDADEIIEKMMKARFGEAKRTPGDTYQGVVGDTCIWEIKPEIEVSDSMIFCYDAEGFNYEVLNDD